MFVKDENYSGDLNDISSNCICFVTSSNWESRHFPIESWGVVVTFHLYQAGSLNDRRGFQLFYPSNSATFYIRGLWNSWFGWRLIQLA